jgi:hypothetical protein
MTNRKQRRQGLAKLRTVRDKLDGPSRRVVDQLLAQNGRTAPTARMTGNGMTVAIRSDKLIARITCHLNSKPQIWIDYNLEQLTGLITYLTTCRDQMIAVPPKELN